MAGNPEPATLLSRKLAPWLFEPLERLERALGANRLGHGWLLAGPAGIGKINLALVFAQRLLAGPAAAPPEPLPAEEGLAAYRERRRPADHHPDLHWIIPEEDKRSISIEQIRDVTRLLALKSFRGPAKVVVVEPAEAMTSAAANALLKTLEEPTPDTYLLLVSDRPGRLPATIRSRCQRLAVAAPTQAEIEQWLGAPALPSVLARRAPLAQLGESDAKTAREINELQNNIDLIYEGALDPQALAERWLNCDLERILEALTAYIQQLIRARFAMRGTKPITDHPRDMSHNAQAGLTLALLFGQLRASEGLREQLGRGINIELAVRVLLSGFKPV